MPIDYWLRCIYYLAMVIFIILLIYPLAPFHIYEQALQNPDCSECYCGWCGGVSDLLSCTSCKVLFCTICIKKNFGEERLSELKASGWRCCCCSPSLLQRFILECEKALKTGGLVASSSDSDSGLSEAVDVPIK